MVTPPDNDPSSIDPDEPTRPPAGAPPGPGSTFGPYRIDSVVGVGGMGVVYLATDQRLGRSVALKTVIGHLADSATFVERFQREAAALARLESPHVVQIFDHGVHDGTPFIATQYAGGGDLGKLLARRGPMPPALAAELCAQVAEALRDAHRVGVVHRDVKPANVLLRDDRLDRVHVLLCDFGVAQTEASPLTEPGAVPGTWSYLAPERIDGDPGSIASDVYAVGCLLYEALTGQPPFTGSDVEVAIAHQQAPVPQLPGGDAFTQHANRVLTGTMAKDPSQRYQSASVLRDDLRSLAGIPSHPPHAPAGPPPPPPPGSGTPTAGPGHGPATPTPTPPFTPMVPAGATAPAYAPGSGGRSKPGPLVWVAVVVVALLALGGGAGIAIAVRGDDEPQAERSQQSDPTGDPTSGEPTESDPTESEPTDPETSEPAPDPSNPDTSGPIRGDVNGDGFGDLALLTLEGLQVYTSDGTALGGPVKTKRPAGLFGVAGDFDNDDELDILRIQGEPPQLTASIARPGAPSSPIRTPTSPQVITGLEVATTVGDVNGDGNLDLVLATRLTEEIIEADETQFDVALGDGTGAFAATQTWFTGVLNEGGLFAFDADGDGTDDVVHVGYDRDTSTTVAQLFRSDGTALTPDGDEFEVDPDASSISDLRVGDVDGDGADEMIAAESYGPRFTVWSWNGTGFDQDVWYDNSDTLDPVGFREFAVTDLNGDRLDDLVFIANDDNLDDVIGGAFISDGTSFTAAPEWGRPLAPIGERYTSYNLLDQDVNGR